MFGHADYKRSDSNGLVIYNWAIVFCIHFCFDLVLFSDCLSLFTTPKWSLWIMETSFKFHLKICDGDALYPQHAGC